MYCAIRNFKDSDFNGDIDSIGEYIYNYNDTSLAEKLDMTKDRDKKIVFSTEEISEAMLEEIENLSKVRSNVSFMIRRYVELPDHVKYFYAASSEFLIDNLDKLDILCQKGVSEAYITGQLAFQMKEARELANLYGVKLRVIPNLAQFSDFTLEHMGEGGSITSFWIRPEDLYLYENYVDTIEFVGKDDKQSIFYDIYFQSKRWNGNLATIIAGLGELHNNYIISDFTESRLNCGKKCILDKCHSCYKYRALSKLLKENNLDITIES